MNILERAKSYSQKLKQDRKARAVVIILSAIAILLVVAIVLLENSRKSESKLLTCAETNQAVSSKLDSAKQIKDVREAYNASQSNISKCGKSKGSTPEEQFNYHYNKAITAYGLGNKNEAMKDAQSALDLNGKLSQQVQQDDMHKTNIKNLGYIKEGTY